MSTPEHVLEDMMRLRWAQSIPEADYAHVIAMVMGFGALINIGDEGRRRKKAVKEEGSAQAPVHEAQDGLNKGQRVEAILRRGEPISTTELAKQAGCSPAMSVLAAKATGAKKIGRGPKNVAIWRLDGPQKESGASRGRGVGRHPGALVARAVKALRAEMEPGVPLSLGQFSKRHSFARDTAVRAARFIGATMTGFGRRARWTLPLHPLKETRG